MQISWEKVLALFILSFAAFYPIEFFYSEGKSTLISSVMSNALNLMHLNMCQLLKWSKCI